MDEVGESRARSMWRGLEPYHAIVYFAAEPQAACAERGANRNFFLARGGTRQQEVGNVRAGDEQDKGDSAEQQQ